MPIEEIIKLIDVLKWPIVVLILFFFSRKSILKFISQYGHVEINSNVANVLLKKLEVENNISSTQIKKLRGLTGHDLWALDAFIKQKNDSFKYIENFSATRKAMVYSFIEMGLLEVVGKGKGRYVEPTELSADIVKAANDLL
ncbi:hypothetical protein BMS3Abin11_01188 [bacterium BMS3Abin11]|nr:hypothetical protein BMS3Abin11_01188 [bacterium BMS3Abin11]